MRRPNAKGLALTAACLLSVATGTAIGLADTTVQLKKVHLCCGACVKAVGTALKDVEDVKAQCDRETGTVTLTAKSDDAAKSALKALGAAGFYGETGTKDLTIPAPKNVPSGKVIELKLSNAHNCCGGCTKAIKDAVTTVLGVNEATVKPKTADFNVNGEFSATEVVKALNAAGFQVKVRDSN